MNKALRQTQTPRWL